MNKINIAMTKLKFIDIAGQGTQNTNNATETREVKQSFDFGKRWRSTHYAPILG